MSKDRIEIELVKNDGKWGQIVDDGERTLIGMYELGKVQRQLFYMDRGQLRQLVNTLTMIVNN
jgi:hypothetical protein